MQTKSDRRKSVLNKLQNVIKSTNSEVAAERCLAIERWLNIYTQVEYFNDNKLRYLYNIFLDENCWSGATLNNSILGLKLMEEMLDGIQNPFPSMYNIACRYCAVEKILPLFQEQFKRYKASMTADDMELDGDPYDEEFIRNDLLDSMGSYDPAYSFWIDRQTGGLKNCSNIEGFRKAVDYKWIEGVEYFCRGLKPQEKDKELIKAILTLSTIQCSEKAATVLDFCLREMDDASNGTLFLKLSEKEDGVYCLFAGLIDRLFFNTVQPLVRLWCRDEVSIATDKILSVNNYILILSSLSNVILENPDFGAQAMSIFMELWRAERFDQHRRTAVDPSQFLCHVHFEDSLAELIVHCKNDGSVQRKNEIIEILQFAKQSLSEKSFVELKEEVIECLRLFASPGMKKNINYVRVSEELFDNV